MSKKKKYILLLFVILALAAITAGIYLFVNPKVNNSTSYTVDKYPDVVNWCDASKEEENLSVDCKALLINIDTNSCFEVQVITNDKEFKDLTICESNDTLSYTNEVLGYQKLMPIDIIFTYTKDGMLEDYSFNNVSFDKVDDTYIKSIVEEDVNVLTSLNIDTELIPASFEGNILSLAGPSYIVKNSIDECPTSDKLANYLSQTATESYKNFYNKNKLKEEEYTNFYASSYASSTLEAFFACDSSQKLDYSVCDFSKKIYFYELPDFTFDVNFNNDLDEIDKQYIKYISNFYDISFYKNPSIEKEIKLEELIESIASKNNLNVNVICSLYKLLQKVRNTEVLTQEIRAIIYNNFDLIDSPICTEISAASKSISQKGMYLKTYYNSQKTFKQNDSLRVYYRCVNLSNLTNND